MLIHVESQTSAELSPLIENPAAGYLASLAPGSRRTMKQSLNAIAQLVDPKSDLFSFPWHMLKRPMTMAIRSKLSEMYAPATANKMLIAMKQVLKECVRLDLLDPSAYAKAVDFKPISGERPLKGRALDKSELRGLLDVCEADKTKRGIRDKAMLAILRVGLRRSEVVGLDVGDIDLNTGAVLVRAGKGNKTRTVYLSDVCIPWMQQWLNTLKRGADAPLFVKISKSDRILEKRMSDSAVRTILEERAREAGITESFSPHDLRRTCVSDLLDAGADLEAVQKLAGHANLETTIRYSRRGEKIKKKAVNLLEF